jgi:hypothetical protein
VLSLAMQASAQRQGANYRRQHLQKQAAPPASPAPATKPARVEDATATVAEPWSAARSKLIVSAESLTVAAYHHETQSTEQDGVTTEVVQSGFSLNLLKGGEFILPFATTRLGLDGVLPHGLTLGASLGYSSIGGEVEATQTGQGLDETEQADLPDVSLLVLVPRAGYLFAPNQYFAVWLRGGFGYARMNVDDPDNPSDLTREMFNLVIDPMLISSPMEHVGILLGPQLNVGLTGSVSGQSFGEQIPETTLTHSSYGICLGLALLL